MVVVLDLFSPVVNWLWKVTFSYWSWFRVNYLDIKCLEVRPSCCLTYYINEKTYLFVFFLQQRAFTFTSPRKQQTVSITAGNPRNRHVVHGLRQKSFKLMWRCHQLLSGFLAKGHLPRVTRQSRQSLMIRVIMKLSWGLCTDLVTFALQLRKTPETSAWRAFDEGAVRPVIASTGGPFPPNEVGRIA